MSRVNVRKRENVYEYFFEGAREIVVLRGEWLWKINMNFL